MLLAAVVMRLMQAKAAPWFLAAEASEDSCTPTTGTSVALIPLTVIFRVYPLVELPLQPEVGIDAVYRFIVAPPKAASAAAAVVAPVPPFAIERVPVMLVSA